MPGSTEIKTKRRPAPHGPVIELLEATYCRNPLRPLADRQVHRLAATGTDTVDSVVKRLGLQGSSLVAEFNGAELPRRRWHRKRMHATDALVLRQRALGPEIQVPKFILEALATVSAFVGSEAFIAIALNVLANSLASRGGRDAPQRKADPASYSIEGGANARRRYGPLLLVLGEHRVFPDYATLPFSEFVPDTERVIINGTPIYETRTPPSFDIVSGTPTSPWTELSSPVIVGGPIYGDNAARTYETTTGTVTVPHTFVVQRVVPDFGATYDRVTDWESAIREPAYVDGPVEVNWREFGPIGVIVGYGYTVSENTERLTSVFNWGLGDLEAAELRVGPTELDSFTAWQRHDSVVPAGMGDRTRLTGYTTAGWSGDAYPGSVQTVEGGKLEQHDGIENSGWIERQGSVAAPYVQLDVAGRLFRQGGGGIENLSCVLEAEYQLDGSSTWVAFPFSPVTVTNGDTTPVRNTYAAATGGNLKAVRVRRTTADETDANNVSELELRSVKFFRVDTALYPAQLRTGLIIRATGQLNGAIDRLSGLVKAKHWAWDSSAAWTPGLFPGDGASPWVWRQTRNPAWLFLYYARGGFLNPTAAPSYLGGLKGWLDRRDTSNGPRLFGAGLVNARIDYAAIVAWGQWCDSQGLECRMAIDTQRRVGDVLDDIAAAGRARKSWATGKLSVWWEAAGQPVVAGFGMSNILAGTFKVSYATTDDVDEFALDYTRSDDDYNGDTVYAAVPGAAQLANQTTERAVYSMSRAQAQQLVNGLAASRYYHRRRITWESGLEALAVQTGDVVRLAHDLTRWAFSGRLVRLVVAGGYVTSAELSREVDNAAAESSFYLWVRKPSGDYMSVQCTPPSTSTAVVAIAASAWPVADAPEYLDAAGTLNEAVATAWQGTIPEDWHFFAGPTPTPGKRVRIVGMSPANSRRVRITARDEAEEYYPLLTAGVEGAPGPVSGERLVARAYNLAIAPAAAGGYRLAWELEAAHGANVSVSVNGGAPSQVLISGHLTVAGTELLLPAYTAGSTVAITVLPVAAGTPIAVQGDSLTFTA